jgi:hypothetical protein
MYFWKMHVVATAIFFCRDKLGYTVLFCCLEYMFVLFNAMMSAPHCLFEHTFACSSWRRVLIQPVLWCTWLRSHLCEGVLLNSDMTCWGRLVYFCHLLILTSLFVWCVDVVFRGDSIVIILWIMMVTHLYKYNTCFRYPMFVGMSYVISLGFRNFTMIYADIFRDKLFFISWYLHVLVGNRSKMLWIILHFHYFKFICIVWCHDYVLAAIHCCLFILCI